MRVIHLTKGAVAVVDDADFDELSQHKWHLHSAGYAGRSVYIGNHKSRCVLMHRQVLRVTGPREYVDHVSGDKLDNRRSNLRRCTQTQNCGNWHKPRGGTSPYRGVSLHRARGKWQAHIRMNNRSTSLGNYRSEVDAAKAYDLAALRVFGEFAHVNFPATPEKTRVA